jgi:hypothetical protein
MMSSPPESSINEWADYWRYQIGVNVIPADTKNKTPLVEWKSYQNVPILEERHDQWKQENVFSKGIAIIVGKIWHNPDKKGLYLNFIDLDNKKAIDEFCTRNGVNTPLKELAKHMIIEQHSDEPNKAHAFCYSTHPFKKKSSDRVSDLSDKIDANEMPAIEIKGSGEHGLAFVTPSPHKNGHNYGIIDTLEPETLDVLELHLDSILREHGLTYLNDDGSNGKSLAPIQDLFQDQTKIYEGHNRHEALLRVMESLIKRNFSILRLEQIRTLSHDWNKQHCVPPLGETEEEQQWRDAIRFIDKSTKDDGKSNTDKEESDRQQNNAEILVDLAEDNIIQFFRDQYGTAFASVTIQDHNEVIALESGRFKRYLAKLFYDNNDKSVVGADAINNSIQILQAKAEYGGHTIPLSVRIAWSTRKDVICYDLTDEKWRCIEIRKDDWGIINNSPPLFVRYNQISQVLPEKTYLPNVFDRFLNLTNLKDESNKLLLKVYIIATFIPEIAHPMLILHGEKGSAKSTLQTLIKRLVDPSKPVLLTVHNDRNEFVQQLAHNHVAYYDNIKYTPRWLSDEACKAVTGVGQTKRKLYTNDEDIVYEYKRCLGFNGINVSLTEPDALDRSIMIELQRIPKESRQLESSIYSEFEEIKPKLLGIVIPQAINTDIKAMQDYISTAQHLNPVIKSASTFLSLFGDKNTVAAAAMQKFKDTQVPVVSGMTALETAFQAGTDQFNELISSTELAVVTDKRYRESLIDHATRQLHVKDAAKLSTSQLELMTKAAKGDTTAIEALNQKYKEFQKSIQEGVTAVKATFKIESNVDKIMKKIKKMFPDKLEKKIETKLEFRQNVGDTKEAFNNYIKLATTVDDKTADGIVKTLIKLIDKKFKGEKGPFASLKAQLEAALNDPNTPGVLARNLENGDYSSVGPTIGPKIGTPAGQSAGKAFASAFAAAIARERIKLSNIIPPQNNKSQTIPFNEFDLPRNTKPRKEKPVKDPSIMYGYRPGDVYGDVPTRRDRGKIVTPVSMNDWSKKIPVAQLDITGATASITRLIGNFNGYVSRVEKANPKVKIDITGATKSIDRLIGNLQGIPNITRTVTIKTNTVTAQGGFHSSSLPKDTTIFAHKGESVKIGHEGGGDSGGQMFTHSPSGGGGGTTIINEFNISGNEIVNPVKLKRMMRTENGRLRSRFGPS